MVLGCLWARANVDATSSVTLATNLRQAFCNTSGGAFTVTLPASPVKGDSVRIFDVGDTFDSNNLTIGRNGNPIMGDAADMVVSTEGAALNGSSTMAHRSWRIIASDFFFSGGGNLSSLSLCFAKY